MGRLIDSFNDSDRQISLLVVAQWTVFHLSTPTIPSSYELTLRLLLIIPERHYPHQLLLRAISDTNRWNPHALIKAMGIWRRRKERKNIRLSVKLPAWTDHLRALYSAPNSLISGSRWKSILDAKGQIILAMERAHHHWSCRRFKARQDFICSMALLDNPRDLLSDGGPPPSVASLLLRVIIDRQTVESCVC